MTDSTDRRRIVAADFPTWLADEAPADLAPLLVAACCGRGKRKGRVLASIPSQKGARVIGAWRALISDLAPMRAGMFAMLWADDDEREAFDACDAWLRSHPTARNVLRFAGQGFCEFNLAHSRVDERDLARFADHVGISPAAFGILERERRSGTDRRSEVR